MDKEFTISFLLAPNRVNEIKNALNSIEYLDIQPDNIILFLNPIGINHIDISNYINKYKIFILPSFHSIAYCWNQSLIHSKTRYTLICNDDIIFHNEDVLNMIYDKHKEGYKVVSTTDAWSATSFDKELIVDIGWFDERFPYSWEDVDMQFRMIQKDIKEYRFNPHTIKHLNIGIGRRQDLWDKSSEFFFNKWDMSPYIKIDNPSNLDRWRFLVSGDFDKINRREVRQIMDTPDFYPEIRQQYKNKIYGKM